MTVPPYVLTAVAEADLRSTIRYTRQQWGEAQVRAYMDKLERGIQPCMNGTKASLPEQDLRLSGAQA